MNNEVYNDEEEVVEVITETNSETTKQINPWIERAKGLGIVISFFVVQFFASVLMMLFISMENISDITQDQLISLMLSDMFKGMVIAESIFIIIIAIIYRKVLKGRLSTSLNNLFELVIKIAVYYAILWGVTIVFSIIDSTLFPQYLNESGANQDLIEQALTGTPNIAMIISICLTAPIVEEFIFRYGIISKLLYGFNKYLAAVLAALIFAFAHIGFSQMTEVAYFSHLMIGYLGQALVFSFIYAREESLFYPIVIHILNNVQAVILIILLANYA